MSHDGHTGCEEAHESLSARLDGELTEAEGEVLELHLQRCPACQSHERALNRLHRRLRVRPAEDVPDLSESILLATAHLRRQAGHDRPS